MAHYDDWIEWIELQHELGQHVNACRIDSSITTWWKLHSLLTSRFLRTPEHLLQRGEYVLELVRDANELVNAAELAQDSQLTKEYRRLYNAGMQLLEEVECNGFPPEKINAFWVDQVMPALRLDAWNRPNRIDCALESLRDMPEGAHLIVQVGKLWATRGKAFTRHGREKEFITHHYNDDELSGHVQSLLRELERGRPINELRATIAEIRLFMKEWPQLNNRLYYYGLGACTRLPLSLFVEVPVVRVRKDFRFAIAPIPPLHRGVALWSNRAPRPLQFSKEECLRLDGFTVVPATRGNVLKALMGATPVHIACHAEASTTQPKQSKLVLTDGELNAEELQQITVTATLIYLSCCQSGLGSLLFDHSTNLADVLLDRGAKAVVASTWKIPDEQAMTVAEAFWRLIRQGVEPPEALHQARQELRTSHAHAFELHY